ncbi:MAG: hypothetical protein HYZ92_05535 [Candidatus Omnitrophica bacterium]|nr:hypothetical protein [Candidatus Omnitrophota bacterium]
MRQGQWLLSMLALLVVCAGGQGNASGQTVDEGKIKRLIRALERSDSSEDVIDEALRALQQVDPKQASPRMIEALFKQLERGHARAARILGRLGDSSLILRLEPFLNSADRAVAALTRDALAKLGDQRSLGEVVKELDDEIPWNSRIFERLVYIGSRATVRNIAVFLYHPGGPINLSADVGVIPYRYQAAEALSKIVDDPPVVKESWQLSEQDMETWKAWWETHEHEYP